MGREPSISRKVIVEYILAGNTTQDARHHFAFINENVANLRVHAAFKALGITRPRFQESRACQFCQREFVARSRHQRTCGATKCQEALIREWQTKNPDSKQQALAKYRKTEKGRQNNLRMHRTRRSRGLTGTVSERWNFAASEIKKSLRKLDYLATRNPWEYRLQHIQKVAQMHREFTPRTQRRFTSVATSSRWQEALRAVQTTHIQTIDATAASPWECAVNSIAAALRTGHKVREWKQNQTKRLSP